MSSNCVECNKEFIQFETGNSILCAECHRRFRSSVTVKLKDDKKSENIKNPFYTKPENPMSEEQLIKSEKYYHSFNFHNKNIR